ncbi:MAG: hypothetical protein WCQ47_09100 [bacterium]
MDTNTEGKVLIGIIEINEAKRLKEKLFNKGIDLDLIHNDQTCKKSYQTKIEVWVDSESIEAVQQIIHEENMHFIMSEGVDVNTDQLNQVFDTEADTTVCPACGTTFSTKLKECPDCGLVFFNE